MFSVGVFSHILQIDDSLIGVMSSMSKILASFVYAFAQTDWQLYMGKIFLNCYIKSIVNFVDLSFNRWDFEWHFVHCDALDRLEAGNQRRNGQSKLAVRGGRGACSAHLLTFVRVRLCGHHEYAARGIFLAGRSDDRTGCRYFLVNLSWIYF